MKWVALVMLAGCNLYFGHSHGHGEDDVAPPDADWLPPPPDGGQYCSPPAVEYCKGGVIYEPTWVSQPGQECPVPTMDGGTPVGTCPYGCMEDTWGYGQALCFEASPPVYACAEAGACTAGETDGCAAPLQCGIVVSAGQCTCDATGTWSCAPACNMGMCGAAEVQAKLAGDWTGTVTPPSFAQPYTVHLHINADGTWSGTGQGQVGPFYYGDGGGNAGSRIVVQAQTNLGGYGSVGIFDGSVQGFVEAIQVDSTRLSFQFIDSWLSCTRTFSFELHR